MKKNVSEKKKIRNWKVKYKNSKEYHGKKKYYQKRSCYKKL